MFLYVASNLPVTTSLITSVETMITDFIWDSRRPKIKKNVIIQDIQNGGIKAPDFLSMIKANRVMWVKRALESNGKWKSILLCLIKPMSIDHFAGCNLADDVLDRIQIPFYKQMFLFWNELRPTPIKANHYREEILWSSKYIMIPAEIKKGQKKAKNKANKSLLWKEFYKAGIVKVGDLFNERNEMMDYKQFSDKYNVRCDILKFYRLRKAIPMDWVHAISDVSCNNVTNTKYTLPLQVCLMDTRIEYTKIKAKRVYNTFVIRKLERPTALCKWEQSYDIEEEDWVNIFALPYSCTRETRLQAFQYRIIHRILPCRKWLHTLTVVDSNLCILCNEVDDIEHFLFSCSTTRMFWKHLERWWNRLPLCKVSLTLKHIVFGVYYDLPYFAEVNFIVLLAKHYIYLKKHYEQEICFFAFLGILKHKLTIEEQIHKMNNTLDIFNRKWQIVYSEL